MGKVTKDMGILDIVQQYPEAVEIFQKYGMGCLGCAAARFENLEAGAKVHGVDPEQMVAEINELITNTLKAFDEIENDYDLPGLDFVKTPSLSFIEQIGLAFQNLSKLKKRISFLAFPFISSFSDTFIRIFIMPHKQHFTKRKP